MSDSDQDWVSRTQKKKNVEALQDLGVQLTKLADSTLKKIGLPEDLLDALLEHKKINSNGALKRQVQYIGRLMRDVDAEPIEAYLAKLRGDNTAHNASMQRIERTREHTVTAGAHGFNQHLAHSPTGAGDAYSIGHHLRYRSAHLFCPGRFE